MQSLALLSLFVSGAYGQDWSVYWTQAGPGPSICTYNGELPPPGFGAPTKVNGYYDRDGYELSFSPPLLHQESDRIDITRVLYEPNKTYTITLQNEDTSKNFGGFFVGQVTGSAGSDFSHPSAGAQVLGFGCAGGSRGIGHTNGNVLRNSVSAKWTAPDSGDFQIAMTVKEDTDMQNGKWVLHRYSFRDQYKACADYADDDESCQARYAWCFDDPENSNCQAAYYECMDADDYICQAPAVLDENGRCSMLGNCPANINFGNASTNCCKLPPPAVTPAPAPDTSKPVTPSTPSDDSSDTQNTATTIGLSMVAVALSILLASMI